MFAMTQPFRLLPRGYLREEDAMSVGVLGELELKSRYQVIISPALLRSVGMEAQLLAQRAGRDESVAALVGRLTEKEIADLDRLALAVHTRNAPATPHGNEWLFLPVHPQTIRQKLFSPEEALRELSALDMSPSRIVLEIADSAHLSDTELQDFVSGYREAGFRIAMDDFGSGASNFDRVLALRPDIVRLDPSLVQNAGQSPRAARLFPHMISLLRESGSLALVDGIQSEAQARIAVDADAELLQGDWFAPAEHGLPAVDSIHAKAEALMGSGKTLPDRLELRMRSRFMAVWNAYRDGKDMDVIVNEIPDAEVTRVYVIDAQGYQIGDTALTPHALRGRQHPLSDARGACWARRQYFRNAVEQPGRVQISRPYLSLTEQRLCVTYSCVVMRPGLGQVVLCMDALTAP
jgi:EAL domain-containing protein (putative c-di-GMP-specific phosphodiesterase class I)